MPRVPRSPGSQVPAVSTGVTPGQAVRTTTEALAPLSVFERRQHQVERTQQLLDATTQMARALNESQLASEKDQPAGMLQAHEERIRGARETIHQDVLRGDAELIQAFEQQTAAQRAARAMAVAGRQRTRQTQGLQAAAEERLAEAERSVALAPSDDVAQSEYAAALEELRSLPINAAIRQRMEFASQVRVDDVAARQMLESDPQGFLNATDSAEDADASFPNLTGERLFVRRQQAELRIDRLLKDREDAAEALQKERQDTLFREIQVQLAEGTYSVESFATDSMDLSATQASSVRAALGSASRGSDDRDELLAIQEMIETDPDGAVRRVDQAFAQGLIATPGTWRVYRDRAVDAQDQPTSVNTESRKLIRSTLGPAQTDLGIDRIQAGLRMDRALEEYDRFVADNPDSTERQRIDRRREIIQAFSISPIDTTATLRVPQGYGGTRGDLIQKPEILQELSADLLQRFERGDIDEDTYLRQAEVLQLWQQQVQRMEALREANARDR